MLQKLGSEHAGRHPDGLDEISIVKTFAAELDNQITSLRSPQKVGINPASLDDLVVEDAAQSANIVQAALDGSQRRQRILSTKRRSCDLCGWFPI